MTDLREPSQCRWSKSGKACWQPVSLLHGEGREDGVCTYHFKLKAGLIDAAGVAARPGVRTSDVLSDEQTALAESLERLGASREVVRRALTREAPMPSTASHKAKPRPGVTSGHLHLGRRA